MGARVAGFCYGVFCYLIVLATLLYTIGFLANEFVPKSIDSGPAVPIPEALLVNLLLIGLFGLQHSLMANPAFKRWWAKLVPVPVERSTYVLFASLALGLLFWQWRPISDVIWDARGTPIELLLWSLYSLGWLLMVLTTFAINHFQLFGLRQAYYHLQGKQYQPVEFKKSSFYEYTRNPMMIGFLIAFWLTPLMTWGHLFFAIGMTAYILVGIRLEERTLLKLYGESYDRYRRNVSRLLPVLRRK